MSAVRLTSSAAAAAVAWLLDTLRAQTKVILPPDEQNREIKPWSGLDMSNTGRYTLAHCTHMAGMARHARVRALGGRAGQTQAGFSLSHSFFFVHRRGLARRWTAVPTSKNTEAGRLSPPTFCWCAAGLLVIGPQLFKMKFLTFLYLNHNGLTFVPPEICELRSLTLVDLSHNKLRYRCRAQPRDRFATQHTHQPRPAPVHPGTPARNPNVAASRPALTGC